jgi:PTS system nitrogen regulatory IIA component
MDLRVKDVARLLDVSEDTVYRLAREGSLPAHRVGEQYRFNRVELQEWAATHGRRVSPRLFAAGGSVDEAPSLHDAIERGGIYFDLPGNSREKVLEAVARLPGIPSGVDRALLQQLLIGRETLAPTAFGGGIAMPHPRDPLVVRVDAPHVLLCFLKEPVDFQAMDGRPVRVLLTVLSQSIRVHLQLLAQIAFALHDETLLQLLGGLPSREAVLDRFRHLESEPHQPPAPPGEHPSRRGLS